MHSFQLKFWENLVKCFHHNGELRSIAKYIEMLFIYRQKLDLSFISFDLSVNDYLLD